MSNTFNINRFGKYWLYDLKMAWKRYGFGFLYMSIFPIIYYILGAIFIILFSKEHNLSDYHGIEFAGRAIAFGIASGVLVLSYPKGVYGLVTDKEKGSAWLMLPASRLEKFTAMMLNCLVIVPIILSHYTLPAMPFSRRSTHRWEIRLPSLARNSAKECSPPVTETSKSHHLHS